VARFQIVSRVNKNPMKKIFLISISILFLFPMCQSQSSTMKIDKSIHQVGISIVQNGKTIHPKDGVVALEKATFDFILDFPDTMAVLVNASFNDDLYQLSSKGKQLATRIEFSKSHLMAVGLHNSERTIFISDEGSSPWFYEDDEINNFNKVEFINNHYRCTRTIHHLSNIDAPDDLKFENINDPIYMVFAPSIMDEYDSERIHFQGKTLKIEWAEDVSCETSLDDESDDISKNKETILYRGTLNGNLKIQLYMNVQEHPCGGNLKIINAMYKYDSQKKWLLLSATTDRKKENYCLVEDEFTGVLFLEKKDNSFNGKWLSPNATKQFRVELEKVEIDETTVEQLNEILFDDLLYNKNDC